MDKQQCSPLSDTFRARYPIKQIVLGIDLSETSDFQLKIANRIAQDVGAELTVVNSVPPSAFVLAPNTMPDTSLIVEQTRSEIRKLVADTGEHCAHVVIDLDAPDILLNRVARERDADLIIVGTHGRNIVTQFLLGSVSQALLADAPCPVLILGPEFSPASNLFRTVLFATDKPSTDLLAAQYAGALVCDRSGRLILMHVIPEKPKAEGHLREWTEEHIRECLFNLLDPEIRGDCDHEVLMSYGDASQEILAAADAQSADLIILGTATESPVGDHASWRTLSEIVRNARCPVLVVGPSAKWLQPN